MLCSEIMEILNKLAPVSMACEWDNPGLLAGRGQKQVKKLLVALDATDQTVEEAVSMGADMLLTHHPLIFRPIKNVSDENFIGRRLIKLIQGDIAYYAMHTNFDAAPGCMADLAADRLGLKEQKILEVMGTIAEAEYGIGRYGVLEQALTLKELAEKVKAAYHIPFVTVFGNERGGDKFSRVAICPGSGGSMIKRAVDCGAQVYVTGDISHHEGIDAVALGMAVMDAGHYGIEHIFMDFMVDFLREHLDGSVAIKKVKDAVPSCVL